MDSDTTGNKLEVQEVVKIAGIRNDLSDVLSNGSHIEFSDLAAESVVEHIFDMVGRSLDESEYYEFSEDILHIIRSAFEPRAKMAYGEITKIVTARFTSVDAGTGRPGGVIRRRRCVTGQGADGRSDGDWRPERKDGQDREYGLLDRKTGHASKPEDA